MSRLSTNTHGPISTAFPSGYTFVVPGPMVPVALSVTVSVPVPDGWVPPQDMGARLLAAYDEYLGRVFFP